MFFRRVVTKRNGKEYVYLKLIENYREGGKVKQRVIANLGNIDKLDPEKVNALISGLTKLAEPSATIEESILHKHDPPRFQMDDLLHVWHRLNLSDFLYGALSLPPSDRAPLLLKAMVFHKLLFPNDHRPIAASYPALNMPELEGLKIPGIEFYQAATSLAGIKEQLAVYLFDTLQTLFGKPPFLYLTLLPAEYVGNECAITTAGTTYQIRPYRQHLNILLTIFPPDIPLGCTIHQTFNTADITASSLNLSKRAGVEACLVIDNKDTQQLNSTLSSRNISFIKSLPPEEYAVIPVSTKDLWRDRDAFTINNTLWVKDITKPDRRYIICHDLHPAAASDQALEHTLRRAAQELDKIRSLVRQGKLRRQKTIDKKITAILQKYGCQNYFDVRFDPTNQNLHYYRNEEVINRAKTLQRTRVLETNLRALPALDIVTAFQRCSKLKNCMALVSDLTKIPVVHPYNEFHHSREYITGQALIHMLSCTLERLVSRDLNS
ncbi:MAG: hypothetical protein H0Z39_03780 [Peptococcaceae bacterium]|nr:hypothetical protein [Peptococcaceae bacterium]